TGHVLDPATHGEQLRRIGTLASKGRDRFPGHIRFVTWTLKYSRCHWLQVLGLGEHYVPAEVEGSIEADGRVVRGEPRNVTRFAILPPVAASVKRVRVGGTAVPVPERGAEAGRSGIVLGKKGSGWAYLGEFDGLALVGKRPRLQGPIDDAFTAP